MSRRLRWSVLFGCAVLGCVTAPRAVDSLVAGLQSTTLGDPPALPGATLTTAVPVGRPAPLGRRAEGGVRSARTVPSSSPRREVRASQPLFTR